MVKKWHDDRAKKETQELRAELARKKRVASKVAKEVQGFWKQMLLVVDYQQKLQVEAVKKAALEKHLDFLVGRTTKYTQELTAGIAADQYAAAAENAALHRRPALPLPTAGAATSTLTTGAAETAATSTTTGAFAAAPPAAGATADPTASAAVAAATVAAPVAVAGLASAAPSDAASSVRLLRL